MIIRVRVISGSGEPFMENGILIIHTKVERRNNMANRDVIQQISQYMKVPESRIKFMSGMRSRTKTFSVSDEPV